MEQLEAVEVVREWQIAANAQDIDRLIELSDPNIEIVGPRGSGFGHQLLRDWLARAGLILFTLREITKGNKVVLEQHGTWHSLDTGKVTGEAKLASVFEVEGQRVIKLARYNDLNEALDAAGFE